MQLSVVMVSLRVPDPPHILPPLTASDTPGLVSARSVKWNQTLLELDCSSVAFGKKLVRQQIPEEHKNTNIYSLIATL
ncbi:hypothetical protein E2C01_025974 [Portunus trituberculatus]|uniref:Uncharacterized protein n=1 Tax=Portunus trituberculatus TaxID=210409 RepID=A0A5B7EEV6_PORTR|nr:hypothetical protein [Portunus trituberculatus]